jgi:pyrroline-5-carboxylate reductase
MVSCKFLYDDGETDEVFIDEWASSGGTTVKQLVQLEKDFLKAIVS